MIVNRSQLSQGKDHGSHHEHLIGRIRRFLVITAESPEVVKPCESALDHPSFLSRHELSAVVGMCDHYINAEIMLRLLDEFATVSPVGIDSPYPVVSGDEQGDQGIRRLGIMNVRRCRHRLQNVTVLVCYDVAFHAFDLLVAIYTLLGSGKCGTCTGAVDGSDGRCLGFSSAEPQLTYQNFLELLPITANSTYISLIGRFCRHICKISHGSMFGLFLEKKREMFLRLLDVIKRQ